MKSQDLHVSSEIPSPSSILEPKEQKLKDAVIKLLMSRYYSSSDQSPSLLAQKIKLIEENISSFFPLLNVRPTHPPYATMIMEAIKEMSNGGGGYSNVNEISKYIEKNFQGLPFAHSHFLKHYLQNLVDSGEILYSFSNACYALPDDLNCKPNPRCENEHEQQQKRRRGRLCKKYMAEEEEFDDGLVDSSGDDGLVDSIDISRNSSEESFEVENESVQFCASDNEDLMMELGKQGEKYQRVDYSNIVIALAADNTLQQFTGRGRPSRMQVDSSNIVIGLAAKTLQQRQFTGEGRQSRMQVNQQGTVEQHHQSAYAKQELETGRRKGRGRPRKISTHQQEVVEQHPVDEEGTLQQRRSKGRGRPRKIHTHQQEIIEQQDTIEPCNPNGDTSPVVEIQEEGVASQQLQSKVNKLTKKKLNLSEPSPLQDMSEVMQQTVTGLGGTTPVYWLFEKILSMSDVKPNQGRIFITRTVTDLLTPYERNKYWVLMGNTDQSINSKERKKGCTVMLVEPDGTTSEIVFKIWGSMGKGRVEPVVGEGQPVLTGSNWNALVRKYSMGAGNKLQFWCFRNVDTNELCFAMNNKA